MVIAWLSGMRAASMVPSEDMSTLASLWILHFRTTTLATPSEMSGMRQRVKSQAWMRCVMPSVATGAEDTVGLPLGPPVGRGAGQVVAEQHGRLGALGQPHVERRQVLPPGEEGLRGLAGAVTRPV